MCFNCVLKISFRINPSIYDGGGDCNLQAFELSTRKVLRQNFYFSSTSGKKEAKFVNNEVSYIIFQLILIIIKKRPDCMHLDPDRELVNRQKVDKK